MGKRQIEAETAFEIVLTVNPRATPGESLIRVQTFRYDDPAGIPEDLHSAFRVSLPGLDIEAGDGPVKRRHPHTGRPTPAHSHIFFISRKK